LDLYLRASYQYARLTPASVQESIGLFQAAIAKDPSYARAYAGLAAAEIELGNFGPAPQADQKARAAVLEALRLDPELGDAHGLLASENFFDWDWPRAEREFRLAIEKGAQPSTRAVYGSLLAARGRFAEAQAQCATAENLEPLGVAPRFCQTYVFYFQRQFAPARKTLLETLQMNQDAIYAHVLLGRIALAEHDCAAVAREFALGARRLSASAATLGLAYASACRGETERARGYLKEAAASAQPPYAFELAMGYAVIHDADTAIGFLRKPAAARGLPGVLIEPAFDSIRNDPRFVELERTAGIPR
jgi:Tfp pilus assembly protein PilF